MYKKMLVPLDMSGFAECVLNHVKEIATARAIPEVVLLTVVEPVNPATLVYLGPEGKREAEERGVQGAFEYLEGIKEKLALTNSKVITVVQVGQAADEILDCIEKNGVDLVVLSSHGRGGVSRWFIGSVADRLLRSSPVPVVLVPSLACRGQT